MNLYNTCRNYTVWDRYWMMIGSNFTKFLKNVQNKNNIDSYANYICE